MDLTKEQSLTVIRLDAYQAEVDKLKAENEELTEQLQVDQPLLKAALGHDTTQLYVDNTRLREALEVAKQIIREEVPGKATCAEKLEQVNKAFKGGCKMNLEKYPNLEAILNGTVAGSFRDWIAVRPELEKLVVRVDELETRIKELEWVLWQVKQWGADARSADSYEIFRDVARVLGPEPEVTVVNCTCIACTCPENEGNYCLGCGARTCLAHVLALKSGGSR